MPIETDHPVPLGREQYRFRPWYERPLTQRQVRASLVVCWSITAILVVAGAVELWLSGQLEGCARLLVLTLAALLVAVLVVAAREAWSDLGER